MRVFCILLMTIPLIVRAQSALEACEDQFIDAASENAPTLFDAPAGQPFASNVHLCYRTNDQSFFAMEYWPEQFAPRWVAYRLDSANYGSSRCIAYSRNQANCYFAEESWSDFEDCRKASDPFHTDLMLPEPKLRADAFFNTGHDRGHMAPRQAFSWHVCATYQTFSMANMSPQRALLNQKVWADLEEQVLAWALEGGHLYVVTGTLYGSFPHRRFAVYQEGVLDPDQLYPDGSRFIELVERHEENFASVKRGEMLHPGRDARPERVDPSVTSLRVPGGYFKVVYATAQGDQDARAIAFFLPHTYEDLNLLDSVYPGLPDDEDFWLFQSRIDLIEETSGIKFPAIPSHLKSAWGHEWFTKKRGIKVELPSAMCDEPSPAGLLDGSTRDQRVEICTSALN